MPFFKRKDSEDASATAAKTNGNGTATGKEKINYKARLEHKMYLVRSHFFQSSEESTRRDVIVLEKKAVLRRRSAFTAKVGAVVAMVALINLTFPLILHP